MRDPDDHTAQQPTDTLQVGPTRAPLSQLVPTRWRQNALGLLAFTVGAVAGGAAVLWWQTPEAPPVLRADEHAVELILFDALTPRPDQRSESRPLSVDGAVFLSGAVTSTVLSIGSPGRGLDVRVQALPVTVSPTTRFRSVDLEITVRDCEAATQWAPVDRPFTITWRDESGRGHLDRAGDFGRSMAVSLTSYIRAVCGNPVIQ